VELAPPPIVVETPSPPPEAADPAPAEEKPATPEPEAAAAVVESEEPPAPQAVAEEAKPEEPTVAEEPPAAAPSEPAVEAQSEELGEDAPAKKKEEKAYVTFPYVPRAAYFDDPFNLRRVDSTYVPYSDPAYRFSYPSPNSLDRSNSRNSYENPSNSHDSYNNSYDNPANSDRGYNSSYETLNRVPSYMPSPFEDVAYRTRAYGSYEPSYSSFQTDVPNFDTPYSSLYSRAEDSSHYGSLRPYSADPRYEHSSYVPDNSAVTAAAYERPSFESRSTAYAATPEPTQYASYGDAYNPSSSNSSIPYRDNKRSGGANGSRVYPDLFGFFS